MCGLRPTARKQFFQHRRDIRDNPCGCKRSAVRARPAPAERLSISPADVSARPPRTSDSAPVPRRSARAAFRRRTDDERDLQFPFAELREHFFRGQIVQRHAHVRKFRLKRPQRLRQNLHRERRRVTDVDFAAAFRRRRRALFSPRHRRAAERRALRSKKLFPPRSAATDFALRSKS